MFGEYLERRPKSFQLGVFILLWAGMFLIAIVLQTVLRMGIYPDSGQDLARFNKTIETAHPGFVALSNAIYTIFVFGLPAFIFSYLAHSKTGEYLRLIAPQKKAQILWVLVLAISMVPVISTLGSLIKEIDFGTTARKLQQMREAQINTYLKNISPTGMALNVVLLAMLPAFCEELFFRGVVQKFAFSYTRNHIKAVLIAALFFSLAHLSIFDFVPILLAGIILGWIYTLTGSLWLNILAHFLFNGIQVVVAYISIRRGFNEDFPNHWLYLSGISLIGLILLFISVRKIYKLRSPLPMDWSVEITREAE